MAGTINMNWLDSLSVGIGMCGRPEMAFVLAALGLSMNLLNDQVFSVLVFSAFLLNIFTPAELYACVVAKRRWP